MPQGSVIGYRVPIIIVIIRERKLAEVLCPQGDPFVSNKTDEKSKAVRQFLLFKH